MPDTPSPMSEPPPRTETPPTTDTSPTTDAPPTTETDTESSTEAPPPGPASPASGSASRGIALGVIAFVATLVLLFGLVNLVGRAGGPSPAGGATGSVASGAGGATVSPSPATSLGAGASGGPSPSVPSPLPSASADPVLVGAGDIADCSLDDDTATAALVASVAGTVFTAGDNAYPSGTSEQFRDCYGPTWGAFVGRTRPAPGNHDWETKGASGYLGYFGTAAAPAGTTWYSYDLGTWHVVVLDSDCSSVGGCGPVSDQGRWLTADLKASTAQCTLAIWHHPRFSSGEHGNDTDVAPFWRSLYDAGADVVINGHDHDYERFAPQDPAGKEDRTRGIREFVVGTGGAALRAFPTAVANSELRLATTHGVIRLVLHKSSYEWAFMPTTGVITDSGSGPCH